MSAHMWMNSFRNRGIDLPGISTILFYKSGNCILSHPLLRVAISIKTHSLLASAGLSDEIYPGNFSDVVWFSEGVEQLWFCSFFRSDIYRVLSASSTDPGFSSQLIPGSVQQYHTSRSRTPYHAGRPFWAVQLRHKGTKFFFCKPVNEFLGRFPEFNFFYTSLYDSCADIKDTTVLDKQTDGSQTLPLGSFAAATHFFQPD